MRLGRLMLALVAALALSLAAVSTAVAAPTFAPANEADIRPGSMTFTGGGQCTSNFVFFDRRQAGLFLRGSRGGFG